MSTEENDPRKRKRKRIKTNKEKEVMGSIVEIPALSTSITRKRLTLKVGMFNYGKKSNTITRDEAKARSDEDLKKILELAKSPSRCQRKPLFKETQVLHNVTSDSKVSSAWSSASPLFKRQKSSNISGTSISKSSSFGKSPDEELQERCKEVDFPENPPLKDISDWLCHPLKKKILTMFGNRDCFMETKLELKKFLKRQKQVHHEISPKLNSHKNSWHNDLSGTRSFASKNSENFSGDFNPMDGIAFLKLAEKNTQHKAATSSTDDTKNLEIILPLLEHQKPDEDFVSNISHSQSKQHQSYFTKTDYPLIPLCDTSIAEGNEECSRLLGSLNEKEKIYPKRNIFSIHSLIPFHDTIAPKKFYNIDDYKSSSPAIQFHSQASSKETLTKKEKAKITMTYADGFETKPSSNNAVRNIECNCRCVACIQNKEAQTKSSRNSSSSSLDILDFLDGTTKQSMTNVSRLISGSSETDSNPVWKILSFTSPNPSPKPYDSISSPKFYRHRLY